MNEDLELINTREREDNPEPEVFDTHICETCGAEMTRDEWEEFETQCHSCVFEETNGMVDDDVYRELKFD